MEQLAPGTVLIPSRIQTMQEVERDHFKKAWIIFKGRIEVIAKHLGISRSTAYRMAKEYECRNIYL